MLVVCKTSAEGPRDGGPVRFQLGLLDEFMTKNVYRVFEDGCK
jgi:hypothetical protein